MPITNTMIEVHSYRRMTKERKAELEQLATEAYQDLPRPAKELALPSWAVVMERDGEILSFCNIIERNALFDKNRVEIGGLGHVVTLPEHRGNGFSKEVVEEAVKFMFDTLLADFGLVLCTDKRVPYYRKLGWYMVNSKLICSQSDCKFEWEGNTMLVSRDMRELPLIIDLQGLPW
ncbi:MAG: GNAT family N-acetyltransferase [Saprospiraceae bacterium]